MNLNSLIALIVIAFLIILAGCSPTKVLNVLSHDFGSCTQKNVVFNTEHNLSADFYYTAKSTHCAGNSQEGAKTSNNTVTPTVVFIYGGSWRTGEKSQYSFAANFFTKHGFNVVIPNYRLYPEVGYPEFVNDIDAFFTWFASNATTHGVNTDTVHMVAHSAGAFNAAMYLFDAKYEKPLTLSSYVGLAGPYDFFLPASKDKDYRDVFVKNGVHYNESSSLPANKLPNNNLHTAVSRTLFLHGEADDIVNPKNAKNISSLVETSGVPSAYKMYPDTGHVALVSSLSDLPFLRSQVSKDVLRFLMGAKVE